MTDAVQSPRKSSRRGLRLWAMLALIVPFASVLGAYVNHVRAERRAIAAIEDEGGSVTFDYQRSECQDLPPPAEPPGPRWIRSLIGDELFRRVACASLSKSNPVDDLLAEVAHLRDLEYLSISDSRITEGGLKHIRNLRRLKTLNLYRTQISDEGVTHHSKLTSLEKLSLHGTQVSDMGLRPLSGLRQLRFLDLSGSEVGDEGMNVVAGFKPLESLDVSDTEVGPIGVSLLIELPKLGNLFVSPRLAVMASRSRWRREDIAIYTP